MPLPHQIPTISKLDLADVVVANLGLHVHTESLMDVVVQDAFSELQQYVGAKQGRAAVFREVVGHQYIPRCEHPLAHPGLSDPTLLTCTCYGMLDALSRVCAVARTVEPALSRTVRRL